MTTPSLMTTVNAPDLDHALRHSLILPSLPAGVRALAALPVLVLGGLAVQAAEVPLTGVPIQLVNGAIDVTAADFDGDGDVDIAGVADTDRSVSWFVNPGPPDAISGNWDRVELDGGFTEAKAIAHGDLDGNGHPDIVAIAGGLIRDVAFWLNPGPGQAATPSAWDMVLVDGSFTDVIDVLVADVNLDGHPDIVACGALVGDIQWYENPGPDSVGTASAWDEHVIDNAFNDITVLAMADLDGDGDQDLVGTAPLRNALSWWRNPLPDGDVTDSWDTRVDLATNFNGAAGVCVADLDHDGLLDVIAYSGSGRQVSWWKNPGGDEVIDDAAWVKADIPATVQSIPEGTPRVLPADLDSDGDTDLVLTGGSNENVLWLDNPLVPNPAGQTDWVKHLIQEQFRGIAGIGTADIDGNGTTDVIGAAGTSANEFRWWRNEGEPAPFELVDFRVVSVSDGISTFALEWSSIAAATYLVQRSDDGVQWITVRTVVSQGPLTSVEVASDPDAPNRFWRVLRPGGSAS